MKIFIGGLLPKQRRIIDNMPTTAELRFCETGGSLSEWSNAARESDAAILITKFISHKHKEAVQSTAKRIVYCSGGLSSLKRLIAELCAAQ